jgi:transposase
MRFVPIKSDDQLDTQSLHRVRERWVMRRTAVVNQIRGLLLERGITLRKGRCHVEAALTGILEDSNTRLSGASRLLLAQLKLELEHLQSRIEEADEAIRHMAGSYEGCQRLVACRSEVVTDEGMFLLTRSRLSGKRGKSCTWDATTSYCPSILRCRDRHRPRAYQRIREVSPPLRL